MISEHINKHNVKRKVGYSIHIQHNLCLIVAVPKVTYIYEDRALSSERDVDVLYRHFQQDSRRHLWSVGPSCEGQCIWGHVASWPLNIASPSHCANPGEAQARGVRSVVRGRRVVSLLGQGGGGLGEGSRLRGPALSCPWGPAASLAVIKCDALLDRK